MITHVQIWQMRRPQSSACNSNTKRTCKECSEIFSVWVVALFFGGGIYILFLSDRCPKSGIRMVVTYWYEFVVSEK